MSAERNACIAILAIGAGVALYYALQNDGSAGRPVPSVQGEQQFGGLGDAAGQRFNPGTPLDMRPEVHFWDPGMNKLDYEPVVTAHRYPVVPGGNVSTVMHKGWSAMTEGAPADNDWRLNPPEVAVL